MKDAAERIREAETAESGALWGLLRDRNPEVLMNAALNRNLTEGMAVEIAKNRSAPPEALGLLASDARFKDSYKLKLAICRNPASPQRVTLSLLKFLRIFDAGDLTKDPYLPATLKQKIERSIIEKLPAMAPGVKSALSKRASGNVVSALMETSGKAVILSCLESPILTEGDIHKAINKPNAGDLLIKTIAEHPKWSLRYNVRFALIRNFHTPLSAAAGFIEAMKTVDLKFLYNDSRTPGSTKPFIHMELMSRGETAEEAEEAPVIELEEEEAET